MRQSAKLYTLLDPRLRGDDWESAYLKRHPRAGGDPGRDGVATYSSRHPRAGGDPRRDGVATYSSRHPRAGGDPGNKYKNEKIPEILTPNSRHNQR